MATFDSAMKIALARCNLDGTACTFAEISSGVAGSAGPPSLVVDSTNAKVLIATTDTSNNPILVRCALDGTSCADIDISAGAGVGSGQYPSAALDTKTGKLLIATADGSNSGKPALFRCDLDGTSCDHIDVSAGAGSYSGSQPSLAIDTTTGTAVFATVDGSNNNSPGLFIVPQ